MSVTQSTPDTNIIPQTDEPDATHIIHTEPGKNAAAMILEARLYGFAVEALCGRTFVPQKDPSKLPLCEECKEIYEMYRMMDDDLSESVSE